MRSTKSLTMLAAALALAACTATAPPPPEVVPANVDQYLIDPRAGAETLPPPVATKFEGAWRYALAGNEAEAQRRLAEIRRVAPDYPPATLLEAFLDIRAERYAEARNAIARVQERDPENLPARVYQAEIALREGEVRLAYDLYRRIATMPGAPNTAGERVTELEARLFNELLASAQGATSEAESIRLLREALTFNTAAIEPRILLAQKLVAQKQFDDARRELDPLLNSAPDRPEVQEILAEVDVGRGRYQEAIVRYDRLARRTKDPKFERRLEEIKSDWSAANMPAHYRAALESPAVTRADLAVLLYWTVPSVRFAQNLGTPQIAVDVEGIAGREEMIRAIALGLFDVDPVTRRVSPHRTVSAGRVSQHVARVLTLRGAPCARGLVTDKVLAACGVTDLTATFAPDATVSGRDVQRALEQAAKALQ